MYGYHLVLASVVGLRDGMALELTRDVDGARIAEVFEDDETRLRTFTSFFDQPVPIEAIEWLITKARERL